MKQNVLDYLYEGGIFSYLDIRFARFISGLDKKNVEIIPLAAALVSRHQRQGHICFDLSAPELPETDILFIEKSITKPETWTKSLYKSSVIGKPGEYKPLILDENNRLYLYRYWEYQENLAKLILEKVNSAPHITDMVLLKQG